MVKLLAKYLKPFWLSVVFAVLLLFGQAFSDLSLPHYMSDIVNVGIQQGGISESTPKAISAKALSFLKVFMTDEEKEVIDIKISSSHYENEDEMFLFVTILYK